MKVAVYGSLRKGMGNHPLIEDSKFLGVDFVSGWEMVSLGWFPAVFKSPDSGESIKVEVYEVDEQTFKKLDVLEGYPLFYDRGEVETIYGKAWMYFQTPEECLVYPLIPDGDWVTRRLIPEVL